MQKTYIVFKKIKTRKQHIVQQNKNKL